MKGTSSCTDRNKASPGDSSWHDEPSHVLLSKSLSSLTDLGLFEPWRALQPQLFLNGKGPGLNWIHSFKLCILKGVLDSGMSWASTSRG